MQYLVFSLWFALIHVLSYMIAGMLPLRISKDIYDGKSRLMDYQKDMADEKESRHVHKWFIPEQIVRGILLSIISYPILVPLSCLLESGFFFCRVNVRVYPYSLRCSLSG
ncbi:MAG: hypothetical protein D5S00_08475 [Tindallia sp. MSAO_Bac2]|nr:MAG: hypothetical protein D5S00_08475 [Tindallia sp. MSAO_Bac2]